MRSMLASSGATSECISSTLASGLAGSASCICDSAPIPAKLPANTSNRALMARPRNRPVRAPGLHLMPFGKSIPESQRDSGSKPEVARNELPWENTHESDNPNGVGAWRLERVTTPLGFKMLAGPAQGSSFLATPLLGWRTPSRWDCSWADFIVDSSKPVLPPSHRDSRQLTVPQTSPRIHSGLYRGFPNLPAVANPKALALVTLRRFENRRYGRFGNLLRYGGVVYAPGSMCEFPNGIRSASA